MNPQLLTAIALDRMNEVARQAEAHRRTHSASSKRNHNRDDRPEHRPIVARLRGQYLKRGDARNVKPVHRATPGAC
jgi:hypothetical protein